MARYLLGGGLVTEAGRSAQAERDAECRWLAVRLREFLKSNSPSAPSRMTAEFHTHHEDDIQEAMWILLDAGEAFVDEHRRVALTPAGLRR